MKNKKIALIGLGYVGLPLAVEFGKKREVVGFDINKNRIDQLEKGIDPTLELTKEELKGQIARMPLREEMPSVADELMIVELYSK